MDNKSTETTGLQKIPEFALAVVAHSAGDLRVEETVIPTAKDDEAVLRIAYGGICGSDLHYWKHGAAGESILRAPMRLGHEVSGTVLRAAVDGSGPSAETAVTVHPATPQGGNAKYPLDRPNLSPACTYMGSAAHYPHTDGAFVSHIAVPARMLRALPANLDLRTGALAEPTSVAWRAVSRAGDVAGKIVLVVGAGPIGALVVAVLRRAGAAEIVAVDIEDFALDIATQAGAHRTINATDTAAVEAVEADVTIECSGSAKGLATAVAATARGGRLVMVGLLPSGNQPVPISLAITREIDLLGSWFSSAEMLWWPRSSSADCSKDGSMCRE
ncbi:zinc-binding dehydrogenase [Rhodococcus erythropolis]|uniref:zinc-binding dehydrogenase n=1 Tax=Rhodococcus erythropolis TaxID=1833 RepID=UPI0037A22C66